MGADINKNFSSGLTPLFKSCSSGFTYFNN